MARTTAGLVGGLVEADDAISLDPFILTASELVTELCLDSGYTDARLELIERWLAAHFYAVRDPRTTAERAGSVGANYESQVALRLDLTRYGQQAMLLDTDGNLAALNARMEIGKVTLSATWLGTEQETAAE